MVRAERRRREGCRPYLGRRMSAWALGLLLAAPLAVALQATEARAAPPRASTAARAKPQKTKAAGKSRATKPRSPAATSTPTATAAASATAVPPATAPAPGGAASPKPGAPEAPVGAPDTAATTPVVKTVEDRAGEKTYTFGAQEVEGRLKSPQILYFLRRVRAQFDPAPLGHRSFMLELSDTRRHPAFE